LSFCLRILITLANPVCNTQLFKNLQLSLSLKMHFSVNQLKLLMLI